MKSIRLSLLVYFLLLLTAALAAVSWYSYQTTAQSLRQGKFNSQTLIEAQCEAQIKEARAAIDRRLLRQAQTLARVSRSTYVHFESLQYQLGAIGACVMPNGYENVGLWIAQSQLSEVHQAIYRSQPLHTNIDIENEEALIPNADQEHAQEYFQTYLRNGHPWQRSQLLRDGVFTLTEHMKNETVNTNGFFDECEVEAGKTVRRATLKVTVEEYRIINYVGGFRLFPQPSFFKKGVPDKGPPNPKGKGPRPPQVGFRPATSSTTPFFYIQYATELGPLAGRIREFQAQRDQQLAKVEADIAADLEQLRNRMLWVSLVTLAAIWLGGFGVIQLGLAPLAKMSDAVSQVSPRNFHLSVDPATLPDELRPIATRLQDVLVHLQQAFAREKQAAADISHELRTPLAALMTTLDVAVRKARSPAEYREILEDCRSSGQHMYQLVERLLTLARLDAGVDQYYPRNVDVVDTALQCADLIRPLAKARSIVIRLHLPDAVALQTDPDKLREVLVNLLHNAVEYNKPNGTIDLSVERTGGKVRLVVRDAGIGIKPEALGHIFERFYRADPSRHADTPHAGLGLSIVKSYVDVMGGTIKVDSSDAGTTFVIELPITEPMESHETGVRASNVPAELVR